jgi:putative tricarboxylic transport membrane protein
MKTVLFSKNGLAGLFFIVVAVAFGAAASSLPLGTFGHMGAGFFPIVLTVLLAFLGAIIIARALVAGAEKADEVDEAYDAPRRALLRPLILILGSATAFALTVKPLGFLPATVLAILFSIAAHRSHGIRSAVLVTVVLTVSAWVIFVVGLGVEWPLLGSWFH